VVQTPLRQENGGSSKAISAASRTDVPSGTVSFFTFPSRLSSTCQHRDSLVNKRTPLPGKLIAHLPTLRGVQLPIQLQRYGADDTRRGGERRKERAGTGTCQTGSPRLAAACGCGGVILGGMRTGRRQGRRDEGGGATASHP
jgi:hypothetical protein